MEITVTEAENPLEQMTVQERLNLSKEHYKAGAFDKAIDVLSTISADENPQAYATAQNNLGIVYRDQGKVRAGGRSLEPHSQRCSRTIRQGA